MLLSEIRGLIIYWAPYLTRGRVCNLQCNHSIVRAAQNTKPYFTVSSETPPTWRARFPYLYPLKNRVAQLYPRALGSLYISSYDSQGYGEGILTLLYLEGQVHVYFC
jgi:hypothetical protein